MQKNNKVKAKRVEKNLSAVEVSKKLGISKTTYYKKERGEIDFKMSEAKQLSEIYECQLEDIF